MNQTLQFHDIYIVQRSERFTWLPYIIFNAQHPSVIDYLVTYYSRACDNFFEIYLSTTCLQPDFNKLYSIKSYD